MIADLMSPLHKAADAALYGAKVANLARLMNTERHASLAPLHVPTGFAIDYEVVSLACENQTRLYSLADEIRVMLPDRFALRSSVLGEDGATSSFAGQHISMLNVGGSAKEVAEAIVAIVDSAHSPTALAYRQRRGVTGPVQVALLAQTMVRARISGVMFTGGTDAYVIEAARGLGEAVAQGLVNPDHYRMDAAGTCHTKRLGDQDMMVAEAPEGGVHEVKIDQHTEPLLDSRWRFSMHETAKRCQQIFGPRLDIEWAIEGGRLWILQLRPTTGH